MSNPGIYDGLAPSRWRDFRPRLRGFSIAGTGITDPLLGSALVAARYYDNGQSLIHYNGTIQFAADSTFGSGEEVYGIELPVPLNRSLGGADVPIGVVQYWTGAGEDPQKVIVGTPTVMDPLGPDGKQGREDNWFQMFLPYCLNFGTGAIATGATSTTITHGLGETPAARDIHVTATNAPSTTPKNIFVDTITSTQFNVNVVSSSAVTGLTFAWTARALPNSSSNFTLLANHLRPWLWAAGHSISWRLTYEARR